ncbi:MAG: HD domain-containing protein [Chloroflexia bacterium]|nr:HD domain-containing protein [Chloroflexia bacterium]
MLAALTPGQSAVVTRLAHAFAEAGERLYLVGGIVRDVLLERPLPADLDFATSATPERTRAMVAPLEPLGLYDVGERFGTIGIVFALDDDERLLVEITTFRSEQYAGGSRHPAVTFGASIEDDLSRRDFTANAIAVDVASGDLIDPFGGEADIALGVLRAVDDADARFAEDPLRLLRAARFIAQLGFRLDGATHAAMVRQSPALARISQERVLAEMTKLLCGDFADYGLDSLLTTMLLTVAMPELRPLADAALGPPGIHREKDLWAHTKRVVAKTPARPAIRWAALLHDVAKPLTRSVDSRGEVSFHGHERVGGEVAARLLRRLKADKVLQSRVRRLVELHGRLGSYAESWTDSAVRRVALEAGDVLDDLLDLAAADVTSAREDRQRAAAARVAGLRARLVRLEAEQALDELQSPLDGNDLMALFDRPPGRWIADVKDHLRELVIDGELARDDTASATRIARELVGRMG